MLSIGKVFHLEEETLNPFICCLNTLRMSDNMVMEGKKLRVKFYCSRNGKISQMENFEAEKGWKDSLMGYFIS